MAALSEGSPGSRSAGPAVLAFGGNALLPDPFRPEEQEGRARELARAVLLLLKGSSGIVLVHGNGPQVGMILLRVAIGLVFAREYTKEALEQTRSADA